MQKTDQGFSLVEILFVIAILSVLASLGISLLQQKNQQLKVEKTALQMQQILQAGMAFKADSTEQKWPNCREPSTEKPTPGFEKYLPTGLSGNPWGYTYSCGKNGDKETFIVKVQVPNDNIATQIAALLPNAFKDTSTVPLSVSTEVSGTSGGMSSDKISFRDIGVINIEDSTAATGGKFDPNTGVYTHSSISVDCPPNMHRHLLFLPYDLQTGDDASERVSRTIKILKYEDGCKDNTGICTPQVTFYAEAQNPEKKGRYDKIPSAATSVFNVDRAEWPSYIYPGHLYLKYISYCTRNVEL